ncbi:MAG: metallophosphoesterase, partial [Bacteroidetes bacterium]|nr:metallophosphoesterase [Bacteroidota bacterium]
MLAQSRTAMQVQYASDLHLEFNENQNELWHEPLIPKADILILAGDIVTFKELNEQSWFFDQISKDFKTTYWIPGNHEYYHYDLYAKRGSFVENIRENIFLVNDYAVTIENARLIFST